MRGQAGNWKVGPIIATIRVLQVVVSGHQATVPDSILSLLLSPDVLQSPFSLLPHLFLSGNVGLSPYHKSLSVVHQALCLPFCSPSTLVSIFQPDPNIQIRERSPFKWLGIDSDNESAFINHHMERYCTSEGLEFIRSRPYRKNDNAYIEQKNYTHVRRPFGYLRYDREEERMLIRGLYHNELRLYKNFFQPVMKLIRKERVDGKVKRIYDKAKTPHRKLIKSGKVSQEKEEELREVYLRLNPAELKRRIDRKLAELLRLYDRKRKKRITINPYKKLKPVTVTF